MSDIRFAFVGYDYFASSVEVLCEAGWTLTDIFPTNKNELHADSRKIRAIAKRQKSQIHGHTITVNDIPALIQSSINLILVAGYPSKVSSQILSDFTVINIHPSYLPIGRGPWPQPHIILNNGLGAGVTFHLMTDEFDQGDILCQGSISFNPNETIETLAFKQRRVADHLSTVLSTKLSQMIRGARSQKYGGIWWPLPTSRNHRCLDWTASTIEIQRKIRAFSGHGTFAEIARRPIVVFGAHVWREDHDIPSGTLVADEREGPLIAAADGFVFVDRFEHFGH